MKMHFALNITTKGTPDDVETSALEDNDMSLEDVHKLQDEISEAYIEMIETIDKDITKTKVF
jgi:hypothetical protein